MSVTADLIREFEPKITSWTLIPSSGGRFEIKVDDELVYSKLQTGRFPESSEVRRLLATKL